MQLVSRIEEAVDADFGPVQPAIITAACTAYHKVATKYHDPDDGCDSQSFGYMVWKVLENEIVTLARDPAHGIKIDPKETAFRFQVGRFRFGVYRLGPQAVDQIDFAFPNNDGAAAALAGDNVQYSFELPDDVYLPRSLVLGHIGNPSSGCEQIWIAEPFETSTTGTISGWHWRKLIWRWDGKRQPLATEAVLPPAVPIKVPVLTLKKKKSEQEKPIA